MELGIISVFRGTALVIRVKAQGRKFFFHQETGNGKRHQNNYAVRY